jgi:hypothetical protein
MSGIIVFADADYCQPQDATVLLQNEMVLAEETYRG